MQREIEGLSVQEAKRLNLKPKMVPKEKKGRPGMVEKAAGKEPENLFEKGGSINQKKEGKNDRTHRRNT